MKHLFDKQTQFGAQIRREYVVGILLGFNLFLTGKGYKRTKSLI